MGVGVAIGVGLFATRRQWMPQAEAWGEQFHDRFLADSANDYEDELASDWETDQQSSATFPRSGAGATGIGDV
jgi:hypothetical protein